MSKGKILVIRGGAIGDFILTLPVFTALRNQFPEAHLEVLGYPHIAQLALAGGLVDRVQPIEARALAGFFARNGELTEDLRDYFSEFNIIVSYLYDPDEIFKTNILRCAHGQFLAGPHRPDETQRVHATEVYLKPLERLAIFAADPVPRLALDPRPAILDRILALHPGSGSERKNWPKEKWKELLRDLINRFSFPLLLVGGESEEELLQSYAKVLPAERVELANSLPLKDLASRFLGCAGFIGHDSGITHLAAAVGIPTLALWADTSVEVWQPQGENVVIMRGERGIESLSVGRVIELVTSLESDQKFEADRSRLFRWRFLPPRTGRKD